MIIDGIQLIEGSNFSNATIASGPALPGSPNVGELFYKTGDTPGLYVYDGTAWSITGAGAGSGSSLSGGGTAQVSSITLTSGSVTNGGGITFVAGGGSSAPGNFTFTGGNGIAGSSFIVNAGAGGSGSAGGGGSISLIAGTNNGVGGVSGNVIIQAGSGTATPPAGNIILRAGQGTQAGGYLSIESAASGALIERLRILANGAWSVGPSGSNTGTLGQVLTSNGGAAAPTWSSLVGSGSLSTANIWEATQTFDGSTNSPGVVFTAAYVENQVAPTLAAAFPIDCSLGNNFTVNLGATAITSIAFTNVPVAGRNYSATLYVRQDGVGNKTIALGSVSVNGVPKTISWPSGVVPTVTSAANKTDVFSMVTFDGGETWLGFVAGQNY